jgi:hypothetical protein
MKKYLLVVVLIGLALVGCGENEPATLKQAGISDKQWSGDDARLAAKITVNTLQRIDQVIADADKRGDATAVFQTLDELTAIMRGWNDQQDNTEVGRFRNCVLAGTHAIDGAASVGQGGHYVSRDRFSAALDACKSAI